MINRLMNKHAYIGNHKVKVQLNPTLKFFLIQWNKILILPHKPHRIKVLTGTWEDKCGFR